MADPRESCPIKCKRRNEDIHNPNLSGVGPLDADILLVGEAPGQEEDRRGENFVGPSGQLLNEALAEVGLKREDIRIINAVRCATAGENKKPTKGEIKCCRQYLLNEIDRVKPNVIGCLGAVPMEAVLNRTGITRLKNNVFVAEEFNRKVIPIYHPAYVLRNPGEANEFLKGLQLLAEEAGSKKVCARATVQTRRLNVSKPETLDRIFDEIENSKAFVFDLETSSLNFLTAKILCVALSWKIGVGVTIRWDMLTGRYMERFKKILRSKILKINHNIKFDLHMLRANGVMVSGPFFDTLIAASLIDENAKEKGLDALTLKYLDLGEYWADLDEWKGAYCKNNKIPVAEFTYDMFPYPLLARYAQHDADATFRLYRLFRKELAKLGLTEYFDKYSMSTLRLLQEMEYHGVLVDREKLYGVIEHYREQEAKALETIHEFQYVKQYEEQRYLQEGKKIYAQWKNSKTLQSRFPNPKLYIRSKIKKESYKKNYKFNEKSYIQLGEVLFQVMGLDPIKMSEKSGKPSTDEKVLTELAEKHNVDFAKAILDHRGIAKYISTYLVSTYTKSKLDNRIHANYLQHKVVTGRLCVDKDTLIQTSSGMKKISDVHGLLETPTYAITHTGATRLIKSVIIEGLEEMFEISSDLGNKLVCTSQHRFMDINGTWVHASSVHIGDKLASFSDKFQTITQIQNVGYRQVWDIEVEGDHSYIGNGFINHNSCISPNLQNMPRSAKDYKECLVADEGYVFVKGDLKQAEFRCWAHYSNDRDMIKDIEAGLDIHRRTASEVFGIPEEQVTDEQRTAAKNCVTGDTWIPTVQGLRRIRTLNVGDIVLDNLNKPQQIIEFIKKEDEVYKLVTKYGSLYCTKDHPFFTVNTAGEIYTKPLSELSQNDLVLKIKHNMTDTFIASKCEEIRNIENLRNQNAYPVKIKSIEKSGKHTVYDFVTTGDKVMVANGFYTLDCVFGLMYGRGTKSVAAQYHIEEEDAENVKKLFFSKYPKAALWLDQQVELAKAHKYVRTWLGRYRRLPTIDSDQQNIRATAEREAKNSPIQGLASNMNDFFMFRTWRICKKKGLECFPAVTQHDAQIHLVKEADVDKVVKIMNHVVATSFPDFRVRMMVDIEVGKTLGTLEKYNAKKA